MCGEGIYARPKKLTPDRFDTWLKVDAKGLRAPLHAPQVGSGHAVSSHSPHPLGQPAEEADTLETVQHMIVD